MFRGGLRRLPELVSIDKVSLVAFVNKSAIVLRLDQAIASMVNAGLSRDDEFIAELLDTLRYFHIETIEELESTLSHHSDLITKFAERWFEGKDYNKLNAGISIFYLAYILIAETKYLAEVEEYATAFNLGPEPPQEVATRIMETYEAILPDNDSQ